MVQIASVLLSVLPVEALHSLGPLLMTWGLWTEPNQGDWGSCWPARRRMAGEEKGLSTSGVKGAVRVPCIPPTDDLRKTDPGVLSGILGRGVSGRSSVPNTTTDRGKKHLSGSSSSLVVSKVSAKFMSRIECALVGCYTGGFTWAAWRARFGVTAGRLRLDSAVRGNSILMSH